MSSVVEIVDGVGYAQIGDTMIALWKAPASLSRWREQVQRMSAMAAERSDGIVCIDLILDGSTPPNTVLRQEMQADFRRLGSALRRFIVVPLGDSLWLSVVRTIVRAVLLLSGQSQRQRVVASVREGLEQVRLASGPETPGAAELEAAIAELCTALGIKSLAA